MKPADWASPRRALACWRPAGATTIGTSAVDAGAKNAVPAPLTAANTARLHTSAASPSSSAAIAAWLSSRTRSAAIITVRRDMRSATTPPASSSTTVGISRAARTMPSALGESDTSSTANASATGTMPSPSTDTDCPMNSRRKFRSLSTAGAFTSERQSVLEQHEVRRRVVELLADRGPALALLEAARPGVRRRREQADRAETALARRLDRRGVQLAGQTAAPVERSTMRLRRCASRCATSPSTDGSDHPGGANSR
jgi:hypothetical protein